MADRPDDRREQWCHRDDSEADAAGQRDVLRAHHRRERARQQLTDRNADVGAEVVVCRHPGQDPAGNVLLDRGVPGRPGNARTQAGDRLPAARATTAEWVPSRINGVADSTVHTCPSVSSRPTTTRYVTMPVISTPTAFTLSTAPQDVSPMASLAMIGPSTCHTPFCRTLIRANDVTTRHIHGMRRNSRHPIPMLCSMLVVSQDSSGGSSMALNMSPARTNEMPPTAMAQPPPTVTTRTPATDGPITLHALRADANSELAPLHVRLVHQLRHDATQRRRGESVEYAVPGIPSPRRTSTNNGP